MEVLYKLSLEERVKMKGYFAMLPDAREQVKSRLNLKSKDYVNHFYNRSKVIRKNEMRVLVEVLLGIKDWKGNANKINW